MIVPNSIYINQEKLPDFVQTLNQDEIIRKQYKTCEVAETIDVTTNINHFKSLELYFKTDHHMTSLGAYILYMTFCEKAKINPEPIQSYNQKVVSNSFLGTFDSKTRIIGQDPDKITIFENNANTDLREVIYDKETTKSLYNEDYLYTKDKYSYFLNGNNSKVVVKTKVENSKKLLVVKDSYAHNVIPFLCSNYEEIHVIDPRYYHLSISDYAKENKMTEVLVLYNFSNLMTDIGVRGIK